jgi:hypothetical protein
LSDDARDQSKSGESKSGESRSVNWSERKSAILRRSGGAGEKWSDQGAALSPVIPTCHCQTRIDGS